MLPNSEQPWQVKNRFLELHSGWLTVIGEHLQDHQGNVLEYWRVEKADSVIVLPIQGDRLLLPSPSYRPGIGQFTLDFPGGRIPEGQSPEQVAIAVLQRELGIDLDSIHQVVPLNVNGWVVNSSFSNQKLYGFVAYLDPSVDLMLAKDTVIYSITLANVKALLDQLTCLQCRTVLLDWWLK